MRKHSKDVIFFAIKIKFFLVFFENRGTNMKKKKKKKTKSEPQLCLINVNFDFLRTKKSTFNCPTKSKQLLD